MEHDTGPAARKTPGERFESPFDVPRAERPRDDAAERLEHLSCDPFEAKPKSEGRQRESA
jgi:hypothetical protein